MSDDEISKKLTELYNSWSKSEFTREKYLADKIIENFNSFFVIIRYLRVYHLTTPLT